MLQNPEPIKGKPRPLKIEAHILAYFGDFLNTFEESVKRVAINEVKTLKPLSPSPGGR